MLLSALRQDLYVEGVSVVAHRVMDLTGCDAYFLLVAMENRVFVTARSRGGRLDVARALAAIGGGGHSAAASAVVKDRPLDEVAAAVAAAVPAAVAPVRTVRDVLVPLPAPVELDDQRRRRGAALPPRRARRRASIGDGGRLVGKVALADLERAAAHGLGHAPVKAVMTSRVTVVAADAPLEHAAARIAQEEIGWAPVVARRLRRADRRRTTCSAPSRGAPWPGTWARPSRRRPWSPISPGRLGELGLDELLRQIQAVAAGVRGVYLVGGAVRDLLLGEPGFDVDIAVEGDGIAFAEDLAARLKGHVRPHEKFGTAVVVAHDAAGGRQRVDVASTRSESYAYPAALPKVEHAGIRSDLARRDFTINAMAVSLKPETYGDLLDYYGGMTDLAARRIVVLHNLSFIEDPTRVLRAIRYENRYGLRMDEHTLNLARACCAMDLVGDLSSARLRDELVALLEEEKVDFSLRRMEELGLTPVDPRPPARRRRPRATSCAAATARALAHGLEDEIPRWRLRLVWLLRDLEPEEIATWTERMRIRRHDADVLERALVVGRRLVDRVARGPSEADLYEFARGEPLEAVLAAMALDETGIAAERLGRFLDVTRHVRLAIGGEDLLALGFDASPEMGEVLRSVLHLKLNGVVRSRDEELAAAARLRRMTDNGLFAAVPRHSAAAARQPRGCTSSLTAGWPGSSATRPPRCTAV